MEEFLTSCGADGPLRLDVVGPDTLSSGRVTIDQPFALVGREVSNDLTLPHDQVSRRHAYLQVMAGRVFCVDLGSRTGLWWGKRTRGAGWLDTQMQIGPYRLQLPGRTTQPNGASSDSSLDWNPLETAAADQRILPRVTLEVFNGNVRPVRFPLDRMLTLAGRSTACKAQVPNISVSRYHCALVLTAAGVWIVDLLSREGTAVNGQRVRWACLRGDDQVEIGHVRVRVIYEGQAPAGPAAAAPAMSGLGFQTPPASSDPDMPDPTSNVGPPPEQAEPAPVQPLVPVASVPSQPMAFPIVDMKALENASPEAALLVPVLQQFGLMQQQMMDQFQQNLQMMVHVFASLHRDQMTLLQSELDQVHRLSRELADLQAQMQVATAAPAPRAASSPRPSPPTPDPTRGHAPNGFPRHASVPGAPPAPAAAAAGTDDMHDVLSRRIAALQRERETRWQKILGFVMGK